MNIILFCNSSWGFPLINLLIEQQYLKGLVVPDLNHDVNQAFQAIAAKYQVPFFNASRTDLSNKLPEWIKERDRDLGVCLTFPLIFPPACLQSFGQGIINIHFGKLPDYGGPDLFWILRNREKHMTITYQKMAEQLDCGPVIMETPVPVIPGENYGLLGSRLSRIIAQSFQKLLEQLKQPINGKELNSKLLKRPELSDLKIDWNTHAADEIESIVNAANPVYYGAQAYFNNVPIRILEVSPASVNLKNSKNLKPGTVVHASLQDGLFVICSDYCFLKINIIKTQDCIISGGKLAALGIKAGDVLS